MTRRLATGLTYFALLACGDPGAPKPVKLVKVTVVGQSTLFEGETSIYTAQLVYDGDPPAVAPSVEWTSDNRAVVSIDPTGTAIAGFGSGAGAAIRAQAAGVTGSIAVSLVHPQNVELVPDTALLVMGEAKTLRVYKTVSRKNDTPLATTRWSSDNPGVALVTDGGVAIPVSAGTTKIKAYYSDGDRSGGVQSEVTVVTPPALQFTMVGGGPLPEWLMAGDPSRFDRNCGLASDGDIYCWGLLEPGLVPMNSCDVVFTQGHYVASHCSSIPTRLPVDAKFTSVSVGDAGGGCGLTVDGVVFCFGLNNAGQLGVPPVGSEVAVHFFVDHGPTLLPTTSRFRVIVAESSQRCGIQANGVALCWGTDFGASPTQISAQAWNSIAAKGICGIAADSTAYCWRGTTTMSAVSLAQHWTHIDVNSNGLFAPSSACALASTGEVACWALGTGNAPQSVAIVAGVSRLVSLGNMPLTGTGQTRTCGLTADGDVYCVAATGTATSMSFSIVPLNLGKKLKSFSGNCGLGVDGRAYCWRWNAFTAVPVPGQ